MKNIKDTIASNLKKYRELRGLTQKELANLLVERLNIQLKHNSISAWESGTNSIDIGILLEICKILNISLYDMYGIEENDHSLNLDETTLLHTYRKLSPEGKSDVRNFAEYTLSKEQQASTKESITPTYLKVAEKPDVYLQAAHNDADLTEEEKKLMEQDIDEL